MTGAKKKGGLGRGIGALIPERAENPGLRSTAADIIIGPVKSGEPSVEQASRPIPGSDTPGASYHEISILKVRPNPKQPRTEFDPDALAELSHSIKEFGLLQPIVVRPVGNHYEIVMGERRWRASRQAGLTTIPAIVRETADGSLLSEALLENIHRVNLNPLEEAAAYQQLIQEFGITQQQLADKLGRSRPLIANTIRLLQLPLPVQRKVAAGVLSAGHARALLGLLGNASDAESTAAAHAQMDALAERVVAEGLSVRSTEEAVTLLNAGAQLTRGKQRPQRAPLPEYASAAAGRLSDSLNTKVTVNVGKKKGKVIIEFAGQDDLDRILEIIG
ncbi:MAG: ParB/RepB/Spo0J family partition protein [Corynebacterium sp.]|nr:ParB/RepB/Spo0J family partition protein [Corynebacterium sp.]